MRSSGPTIRLTSRRLPSERYNQRRCRKARARCRATPEDVQPRPSLARRHVQQIVETATATGPPDEESHTDAYGRIKVRFHRSIEVSPLAPATTALGALQRLKNLGYYRGGIPRDPQPDESFRAALRWLQKDQVLPQTGAVDGATAAEHSTVHCN